MPHTDSTTATGGVTFRGLWVHDPLDAEGTIRCHLYGSSSSRSSSSDVEHVGTHYAGREFPVVDFGQQGTEVFQVRIDVPYGDTWRADLDALEALATNRRVAAVRDGRGRSLVGAMSGFRESDQPWGTQVEFAVTRAHEETVAV